METRRAESQGTWRGDACKAGQWAPMESRKHARKGRGYEEEAEGLKGRPRVR